MSTRYTVEVNDEYGGTFTATVEADNRKQAIKKVDRMAIDQGFVKDLTHGRIIAEGPPA